MWIISQSFCGIGVYVHWSWASLHSCIPTLCVMFMHRELHQLGYSLSELNLVKWVVSVMYGGSLGAAGFRWWLTNSDTLSLG